MNKLLAALLLAGAVSVSTSLQAAELKVGYVQVDKILQEAPQTLHLLRQRRRDAKTLYLPGIQTPLKGLARSIEAL